MVLVVWVRFLRFWIFLAAIAVMTPMAWSSMTGGDDAQEIRLSEGLESFLEARRLEAKGEYRQAVEKYELAATEAPEVNEIKVVYASLLLDLGMADKAVKLLENRVDLDFYGLRVKALALAQVSGHRPELMPQAREALEGALADQSEDPNLQFSLARVLEGLGEIVEAEEAVAELRQAMGDGPRLLGFHGRLLARLGRYEEAADAFSGCVDDSFAAELCRDGLAQSLVASGQRGVAGEKMLGWLESDNLDGLMQAAALLSDGGRPAEALEVVRRVLGAEPDSPSALMLEALVLTDLGRYHEAQPRLEKLVRKDKDNVDLLLALAWSSTAAGRKDLDEGRSLVGRAWEIVAEDAASPRAVHVCLSAARLELVGRHPNAAREWLDRIGDIDLAGPQAIHLLAETFRQGENWKEGAGALLRIQPKLGPELRSTAVALEAEMRYRGGDYKAMRLLRPLKRSERIGDVFEALQVVQRLELWQEVEKTSVAALENFTGDRRLIFARASALERLGRFDEAAEQFSLLLEMNPNDIDAANYLGYMWADRNENLDQALVLVQRAVAADPENPAFLDSLGWVQYRLGQLGHAERWLRRAVALGGAADGTVLAHLGEVLLGHEVCLSNHSRPDASFRIM
ncbi:MAG: tetratricopeptide repeat protein [Thermoanaerobaculales bacterium]|nr:tetratricopeptide repeat protein [Thermoanaerobaculales bacterium]